MSDSPLFFKQIEIGPMQNFTYLIGDRNKGECVVVDPAWNIDKILEEAEAEELKITGALVTHCHYDHVNGVEALLNVTDGKVYVNRHEAEFLKNTWGEATGVFINIGGFNLQSVDNGERIKVGDVEIEFLHTPGHTPGSQCFLVDKHLVSGDTLFIGTCGRCDLPGGDKEQMFKSLHGLSKLDSTIKLFPGHNYFADASTDLEDAKKKNPYLQAQSLNQFMDLLSTGV